MLSSQVTYLMLLEVRAGVGQSGESLVPKTDSSCHIRGILSRRVQAQVIQTQNKSSQAQRQIMNLK